MHCARRIGGSARGFKQSGAVHVLSHDLPDFSIGHANAHTGKVAKEWLASTPIHVIEASNKRNDSGEHTKTSKLKANRDWPNNSSGKNDRNGNVKPPSNGISNPHLAQCEQN